MKKDIYKKIAKDVINTEIASLNKLKNSLDINFKKAVEKILNCKKGKVVLSGVGKSGIIAKKIASTKKDGVPTDAKVDAIFFAIIPDLPTTHSST